MYYIDNVINKKCNHPILILWSIAKFLITFSIKKYPNDTNEAEKRRIRKITQKKIIVKDEHLYYFEKDKVTDQLIKRLVVTKDKLKSILKMCHDHSWHQGVNKAVTR